jgi:hypothetical protein
MAVKNTAAVRPYCVRKARSGWYVEDVRTGAVVMSGMAHVGAVQLADHKNRQVA